MDISSSLFDEPSATRKMYEQPYLAAGCPQDLYNEESNVDSSPVSFATCYAISAIGITLSILLLAMSSTASAAPTSSSSSLSASLAARRRKARQEEKKKRKQQLQAEKQLATEKEPQQQSKADPSSSLGGQYSLQQRDSIQENVGADEPSSAVESWRSFEESLMSLYLEDGTISTNPTNKVDGCPGADNETSTNPTPAAADFNATQPPQTETSAASQPLQQQPAPQQISLGSAPAELFPTPSTAENSDPDSELENSTLTTQQDQQEHETQRKNDDYYMTLLVSYFVFTSISFLVLGFGHMTGTDFSGKMPNRVVHGTSVFASCSLVAISALEYLRLLSNQKQQQQQELRASNQLQASPGHNDDDDDDDAVHNARPKEISTSSGGNKAILWTAVWMLCSLPAVIVFVILDSDIYTGIFSGASHFAVLLTALFRVCFSEQRQFLFWFAMDAVAMLFYMAGLVVQLYLDGPCGFDGYKNDCFSKCPLPTSPVTFNHNAVFHICVLVSLLLYGCSKMVQMQPAKEHSSTGLLFRRSATLSSSAAGSTEESAKPDRKHMSSAAALILMEDNTIEV